MFFEMGMNHYRIASIFVLIMLLLVACGQKPLDSTPTTVVEATIPIPQVTEELETPTATLSVPLIIILNPEANVQLMMDELRPVLENLAGQAGMQVEEWQQLSSAELDQRDARVIVVFEPNTEINQLAAMYPNINFLGIGIQEAEPASNISLIRVSNATQDVKNFLAGYIAAVVTQDWRAGLISQIADPIGKTAQIAFDNGMSYFCGFCQPVYPPYPIPGYPLVYELSETAADIEMLIAYFKEWQVQTVYVLPPMDQDEYLLALAQAGFNLIAERKPPQGLESQWIASIVPADMAEAVAVALSRILAGETSMVIDLPLEVVEINPDLFSQGRQDLVRVTMDDLLAGFISTGIELDVVEQP